MPPEPTELFVSPVDETVYAATLSPDGLYRYRLSRTWGSGEIMAWVMLNPSTADSEVDDPTIRRCMGFARREGCDGIEVLNLYGLRATKPKHLLDHPDPEGPDNLDHWNEVLWNHRVGMVVAAWGAHAGMGHLPASVAADHWRCGVSWRCLGVTKTGYPRHPLYVRADTELEKFRGAERMPPDPLPEPTPEERTMTRAARIQGDYEDCGRCGHRYHAHKRPSTPFGPMPCGKCDCVDLRP